MRNHGASLVCTIFVCAVLLAPAWGQQAEGTNLSAANAALHANGAADPDFAEVDATVLAYMNTRHIPGGAVAIVRDGRLVYARGYGWADTDGSVPALPASLFRIASLSKSIT
jgi:CubicO group peptidase (beta-lactamase class C family)